MKKIISFIVIICFFSFFVTNEFCNSITKIEYHSNIQTLKIATKIDINQAEKVFKENMNAPKFELKLKNYMQKNIEIFINDKLMEYKYTKIQENGGLLWIYYEIQHVAFINSIGIKNSIFIEECPSQQNFISIFINTIKKSFLCMKGKEYEKTIF